MARPSSNDAPVFVVDSSLSDPKPSPPPRSSTIPPWTWIVLASVLLAGSAGYRGFQDHQRRQVANNPQACPFPLEQIPRTLGRWKCSPVYGLKLISWDSKVPMTGANLVVVGTDPAGLLHVRVLGESGTVITEADEATLPPSQSETVAKLKKSLPELMPPHQISVDEKSQILADLTLLLGQVVLLDDQKLDSKTLLITGGKEYTVRTYTDESTGVKLIMLLLFGPVEPVIPHVPEVCYPANGFTKQEQSLDRTIPYKVLNASGKPDTKSALFQSAVYRKSRLQEGVYHSFLYDGVWSPYVSTSRDLNRLNLGVFKLQIQRLVGDGESRDVGRYAEPIEDFLESLLPAIDQELREAEKNPAKSVANK